MAIGAKLSPVDRLRMTRSGAGKVFGAGHPRARRRAMVVGSGAKKGARLTHAVVRAGAGGPRKEGRSPAIRASRSKCVGASPIASTAAGTTVSAPARTPASAGSAGKRAVLPFRTWLIRASAGCRAACATSQAARGRCLAGGRIGSARGRTHAERQRRRVLAAGKPRHRRAARFVAARARAGIVIPGGCRSVGRGHVAQDG